LLEIGLPGTFDENGLLVCSVISLGNDRMYLYYVGFELGVKIRYRLLTGLAISEDGGNTFYRYASTPILERSPSELFFRCGPYCIHEPENFRMYWKEFMHQCVEIGIGSLGIVAIISIFMGAVSTVQTAYQLVSPLIPKSTIAQIVRDTVILEFAPTLVCIVLAGVVGSKIASELGNMRVSEQIDALEIMGINTKAYLIIPKILAALITIPLLVILAMGLGIYGGRLAGTTSGILSADIFDEGLLKEFVPFNIRFAMYKAITFLNKKVNILNKIMVYFMPFLKI
jgi:phospholipid/cholesterol/gamma-HCH transport system permease protein